MKNKALLETLLLWLQENVEMGTELMFDDETESQDLIPAIEAALRIYDIPAARPDPLDFREYFRLPPDLESEEFNRGEAEIWDKARSYAIDVMNGKQGAE